jgi:hypothetical protein
MCEERNTLRSKTERYGEEKTIVLINAADIERNAYLISERGLPRSEVVAAAPQNAPLLHYHYFQGLLHQLLLARTLRGLS